MREDREEYLVLADCFNENIRLCLFFELLCCHFFFSYVRCFYWSLLSLATINDNLPNPTNTPEYTFTMFNYLLGVFVMALFISQVSDRDTAVEM